MVGFSFRYRLNGATPTVESFEFKNSERLSQGDILNLQGGKVDLGATGDHSLLGVVMETRAGSGSTTVINVITDSDAVYAVGDDNARAADDTLDLTGATGAQGVAESSNRDFLVVVGSLAAEETLVRINGDRHAHVESTRGRLNADIARAVVRIHRDYVGRGPTKAQAFFHGNVIVVVMQDVMTRAEHSLAASGRGDTVLAMRQQFQRAMRAELVAAMESLTGCKVTAFMSDNHIEPDMAAELFVLDRPVPGGGRPGASAGGRPT